MGRLGVVLRSLARTMDPARRDAGASRTGRPRSPSADRSVLWSRARQVLATTPQLADAELYTVEQLERHAQVLAATQRLGPRGGATPSLAEVVDASEELVRAVQSTLARASRDADGLSPAAAWLLDNVFLVDEQIREVRHDLPAGYYGELPKLANGPCRGHPRVYALALELIAHTDARIDPEQLVRFVLAYDAITSLTMGELWAMAIMLRIGLLASLGRQAAFILEAHAARTEADAWVDRLLAHGPPDATAAERAFAVLRRRYPGLPPALALRLLWRLAADERGAVVASVVERIERELLAEYGSVEAVYHAEHQGQATGQAAVSNAITSLRTLGAIDWADWFERVSRIEQILRQDPAGAYARSTFATRDRDRHTVEWLARRSGLAEIDVARRLVAQASRAEPEPDARARHVGYYLTGPGRVPFERQLGYRPTHGEIVRRTLTNHPTPTYLGALAIATSALVAGGLALLGLRRPRHQVIAAGLLLVPMSEVAHGLVNWGLSRLLPPRVLPRLDLDAGIPDELRTIVVVPMLLLTPDSVRGQLERLQVLALANADPRLHFALLSDFADAPGPTSPEDAALLAIAIDGIGALNARYGHDRFFLFHRRRVWNPRQACYMGWERKRGKLIELNRLLRGDPDTTFDVQIGELAILPRLRYVITLDADTRLPRDAARKLIGTLAHPLNQAVFDPAGRRVVDGYGILQPRVGMALPAALRSRFARLFSGTVGIDPYETAVSNTYMDLFGEGIYAGKGIYDPLVLTCLLDDRFPDDALLSHDLIEGTYARAAFLSDVELLDSFPATYAAYAARQHRWARGDWQVAPWLLPRVRTRKGVEANPLPIIARFKIFDNLRRSLVAPTSLLVLAAGLSGFSGRTAIWVAEALGPFAAPRLLALLDRLVAAPGSPNPRGALRMFGDELRVGAARFATDVAFLPDAAATNLDAIVRTLYRLGVSRRDLLEWETAEQAERRGGQSFRRLLRHTVPAAFIALAGTFAPRRPGAVATTDGRGRALDSASALPVLGGWLAAPAIAAWLDRPPRRPTAPVSADDRVFLRHLARGYWHFFETFVDARGNDLAPDNFQEDPQPVVAYRTSPTNVGLQLLADLAAHDLGYVGLGELTARTERVIATLRRLPRPEGHLLNWLDTQSLQPLPPAYVSTVDSGNLAGALLTLRQGYRELLDRPILGPWVREGLVDTVALARAHLPPGSDALSDALAALAHLVADPPTTVASQRELLRDVATRVDALATRFPGAPWLAELHHQVGSWLDDLAALVPDGGPWDDRPVPTPRELLARQPANPAERAARDRLTDLLARQDAIVTATGELFAAMDFRFLFDPQRQLFAIGHNLAAARRDNSYYDLLASEARLASYLAIGKGDVPTEHWFHLGRPLVPVDGTAGLVSWGGTMFEYLMPRLVMRSFPDTLLAIAGDAAVERQIAYGRERGVPWGISESGYDVRDAAQNYQYHSFGVPGLGLRAGLASDLVVAPYATLLALPIRPAAAIANLRALLAAGLGGEYGLYEAVDYTRDRLPSGQDRTIIRSYMAHHQGMSLLALTNYLLGDPMPRRFHADPLVQSAELLLQERFPWDAPTAPLLESVGPRVGSVPRGTTTREYTTPATAMPQTQLLSNGSYAVLVTNAGGGASYCGDLAVTRWHEDATRDCWGSFVYVRDARSGATWSAAYQPTCHEARSFRVVFSLEKAEFHQQVAGIDTRLEIAVSPEDDVEIRRVALINRTAEPREIEVTSYAEIVLAPPGADAAHPAFNNLFVETEYAAAEEVLLASRRPRGAGPAPPWAFHLTAVRGHAVGSPQYETDRAAFLGRGRTAADPVALGTRLTQTVGAVLDPIFSLRRRIRLVPGGTAQVTFVTGVADTRLAALRLAAKYRAPGAPTRLAEMAWAHAQAQLHDLGLSGEDAHLYQRLLRSVVYADPRLRAPAAILQQNSAGQPTLWAYGISGDYPIVLVRIAHDDELALAQELLRAHQYWRLRRVAVDLVILVEGEAGYRQGLVDDVLTLVRSGRSTAWLNRRGGIFVLPEFNAPAKDRILLQTAARVDLEGARGPLVRQLARVEPDEVATARPRPPPPPAPAPPPPASHPRTEGLQQPNPFGGFSADGCEYVVERRPGVPTTAPWINVVANERVGFVVSESGGGYTWAGNSQQNRLTPWSNDPVTDPLGEALYLRDEATGDVWSPLADLGDGGPVRVRHGFGYTVVEGEHAGVRTEVTLFVPLHDPLKIYRVRLQNRSREARRLSATVYVEWVLGPTREAMAPFVITARDEASGAMTARNPYNVEFAGQVAFLAASPAPSSATGDRTAFVGRLGSLRRPAALDEPELRERFGAGLDPCGALRCPIEVGPGAEGELIVLLGQGADPDEARQLIAAYRDPARVAAALDAVTGWWKDRLTRVRVHTPDPALDLLLNGWLLYQALSCRVWARSSFYQPGGAYGFRDQLQDVLALADVAPEETRAQILRAAGRQFAEGDVQHWWHPPSGRGIRTRCSDDYLWLPFATSHYVRITGDLGILDEEIPFLQGRPLAADETEYYDLPTTFSETAALYEHCARAIDHALSLMGAHGLPLMGSGDWNDGMNLVGAGGKGESVWVGWFLYLNLTQVAELAARRGDAARAARYRAEAGRLQAALEAHAWDGAWYRRAYFDDGTPLGSAQNPECRIDSIAQSWAVISGGARPDRARQAMAAVEQHLVDRDAGLIKLLSPPFDHSSLEPGYIKGYVPGVRENGGQYTHAATWVIWAFAQLGDGQRAYDLFALINPIRHGSTAIGRYKVEPYVVAGDVYAAPQHRGRGGWTWYTGSAGWLYRTGLEMLLGLRRNGDTLVVDPCIPPGWAGYELNYRHGGTTYQLRVENPDHVARGVARVEVDGIPLASRAIPLRDDGQHHQVRVLLGDLAARAEDQAATPS